MPRRSATAATILRDPIISPGSASILLHPSTVITQGAILLFQMAGRWRTSSSGENAKVEPPHASKPTHSARLIACLL
jgi:hypothetical protein